MKCSTAQCLMSLCAVPVDDCPRLILGDVLCWRSLCLSSSGVIGKARVLSFSLLLAVMLNTIVIV